MNRSHFSRQHFDFSGRDCRIWVPTIEMVWDTHKLERKDPKKLDVYMFPDGECPAFMVDRTYVIKFYPPWARTSTYVVERTVFELQAYCSDFVKQHVPQMVAASFVLKPGSEDQGLVFMDSTWGNVWKWPYIVSTVLTNGSTGEPSERNPPVTGMFSRWPTRLRDYQEVPLPLPDGAENAAAFVGRWMRFYHDDLVATKPHVHSRMLRLKELSEIDAKKWNVWTSFESFIMKQRRNLLFLQEYIGALRPELLDQLESYVPRDARTLFKKQATKSSGARNADPVFLHGDLNDDHLLMMKPEGEEHWRARGVIDFGDAMVGDRHFDFVALHISTFRSQKRLLKIFLENYVAAKPDVESPILWPTRKSEFSHVCMCYTLMHRQDAMRTVLQFQAELLRVENMKQLESNLWDVDSDIIKIESIPAPVWEKPPDYEV